MIITEARRRQTHVHGDGTATCRECGMRKPTSRFDRMPGSRIAGGGRRHDGGFLSYCRTCKKKARRARLAARGLTTRGHPRKPRLNPSPKAARSDRQRALRQLRILLGKLFKERCAAIGEIADTIEWRVRYQTDAAFREKEIARTWARKQASGNLRTDGRTLRRVTCDGSLTGAEVQRLFAEATECAYCGGWLHPRDKTLDHLIPVARGGEHTRENVVVACRSCNSRKGARTPLEFFADITARRAKRMWYRATLTGEMHGAS